MVKHVDASTLAIATLAGQVGGIWLLPDRVIAWCDPGNNVYSIHIHIYMLLRLQRIFDMQAMELSEGF